MEATIPSQSTSSEATAMTFTDIFGNDEELPSALLISPADEGFTSAVPLAPEYGFIVEDAVAVPYEDAIPSTLQMHGRSVVNRATQRGRILAEQELEVIERANRNVRAQNYFAQAAVDEANRVAQNRIQLDNLNRNITTATIERDAKSIAKSENSHGQPAVIQGTFGRDYEVSNYDVNGYETKDYEVSPYKSVYER